MDVIITGANCFFCVCWYSLMALGSALMTAKLNLPIRCRPFNEATLLNATGSFHVNLTNFL